jgi:hypothetical protein
MEDMAVRLQDVAATLDDLRTVLEAEEGIDQVLDRLVETARRTIPAAVAVSITVVANDGNSAWTATATDAVVVAIDTVQYAAGQGSMPGRRAPAGPYGSAWKTSATSGRRSRRRPPRPECTRISRRR